MILYIGTTRGKISSSYGFWGGQEKRFKEGWVVERFF
jgi:hypothetical protein